MIEFKKYIEGVIEREFIDTFKNGDFKQIEKIKEYIGFDIPNSYFIYLQLVGYGTAKETSYEFFGTGKDVVGVIYQTEIDKKSYDSMPDKRPNFNYLVITDIGDDVVWLMNLDVRDPQTGECPIVGWIAGLPADEQPDWVKKEEYYPTFEDFFRAKVGISEEELDNMK